MFVSGTFRLKFVASRGADGRLSASGSRWIGAIPISGHEPQTLVIARNFYYLSVVGLCKDTLLDPR
jgi:hypothetical protein